MKVLFISSGNSNNQDVVPFINSQGESLRQEGINIQYYRIVGKGFIGYLKNVPKLKAWLKENPVDIIHAHYSLCGWVAVLAAGKIPVVLSLMGDDAQGTYIKAGKIDIKSHFVLFLTRLIQPFLKAIIIKSPNLEQIVYRKNILHLIPNGVHFQQFKSNPNISKEELGLKKDKQYVLFLGNKADVNKNYALAEAAVKKLNRPEVKLIAPFPIPHDTVVKYLNAADAFVLCSFAEGSPNVIKEAMTCNCPLVATNVGDVKWLLGDTPGCYVASFDPADFAEKLDACLDFSATQGRTQGRARIMELGLEASNIAKRIIVVYHKVLHNNSNITSNINNFAGKGKKSKDFTDVKRRA